MPATLAWRSDQRLRGQLVEPDATTQGSKAKPLRVLVADDDMTIRRIIRRVLTSELGADVHEAMDGLGVLEALAESSFDLLLLDIEMGLIDGTETLEAIRKADGLRELPVIVISGAADEERVKRLKALDVKGLVAKPLSLAVLRDRLLPLIAQVPQPTASVAATVASRRLLQPFSRIFVVGPDRAYWEFLQSQLGRACHVTYHPSATAALRETVTRPPEMVFLTGIDPLMSPALFARAVRREAAAPPRLILCERAVSGCDIDELFDARVDASTPEALFKTLRILLTDVDMTTVLLQPGSRLIADITESTRANFGVTWGEPLRIVRNGTRWTLADQRAVEASAQVIVNGHVSRVTILVTQTFAIRHASRSAGDDADLVSAADAGESAKRLARDVASELCVSLTDFDVESQVGSLAARPMRWCDSRVSVLESHAVTWWLAGDRNDGAIAAVRVTPMA